MMAIKHKKSLSFRAINTFLPTRHNDYRPWIAEIPGLAFVTIALVILHLATNGILIEKFSSHVDHPNGTVIKLLEGVNSYREANGIPDLTIDDRLNRAAQGKVDHMFKHQYWAHVSPDRVAAWSFIQNEKYFYKQSAENLARGFTTPKGVVAGWYASEAHKEAMLEPSYKNVGFAAKKGKLGNETTTLYVALFADPLNGATIVNAEDSRQSLAVQGDATGFMGNSEAISFSLINPLSPRSTLSLAGKVSLFILGFLTIIYVLQHIIMVRKHLPWQPPVRDHPLIKLIIIVSAILIIIATSFGSIT